MAAPTLSDFKSSNFGDTTSGSTAEATPSITWSAGDWIVVIGISEDNVTTLGVPTATGLTFSQVNATNTGSNCKVYCWSAQAAGGGSGAVSSTPGGGTVMVGIAAFVYSGSDGVGNTALMASTSTTNAVQSLTRAQNNSAVIVGMGDWNAVNDVAVTANPSTGGTVRVIARDSGGTHATMYVGSWSDEGAAGATSYGIGSYTATPKWIGLVVEVKGTATAASPGKPPDQPNPTKSKTGTHTGFTQAQPNQLKGLDLQFGLPGQFDSGYQTNNPVLRLQQPRGFTQAQQSQLIGQDKQFGGPGQFDSYDWPLPQQPKRWHIGFAATSAAVLLATLTPPFFGQSGQNPHRRPPDPMVDATCGVVLSTPTPAMPVRGLVILTAVQRASYW